MPEARKKVTLWAAFDGKEFDNKSEAQRYEEKLW